MDTEIKRSKWVYCTPMRYRDVNYPLKWVSKLPFPDSKMIALVRTGKHPNYNYTYVPFQDSGQFLPDGYVIAVMPTINMEAELQFLPSMWYEDISHVANTISAMWVDYVIDYTSNYQSELYTLETEIQRVSVENNTAKLFTSNYRKVEKQVTELQLNSSKLIADNEALSNKITTLSREHNKVIRQNSALALENQELRAELSRLSRQLNPVDRSGYVYLLHVVNSNNLYKIGRTKNPDNRLTTFKSKLPFPVEYEHTIQCDDMYALENELHQMFADKRQNGSEFFLLTPDDVSYIKSL